MEEHRVFVGNLAYTVEWQDLKDHMRQAGNVLHADVLKEPNGRSKGCGIVAYGSAEEAECAISTLHDTELNGRLIFVRQDREGSGEFRNPPGGGGGVGGVASRASAGNTRVYVGNLSWNVDWKALKDHMKSAGHVLYADVVMDGQGRSRGYGLVEYETEIQAQGAINFLHDSELNGRKIFVREDREPNAGSINSIVKQGKRVHSQAASVDKSKLFVGNLAFSTTSEELMALFQHLGDVEKADVAMNNSGSSKGFGIVKFRHEEDAESAIKEFNGHELDGRTLTVRYDNSP